MKSQLHTRLCFFTVYFGFLILNCALTTIAWQRYYLTTDGMIEILGNLRSVYIAPMTIVLVGIFDKLHSTVTEETPKTSPFLLAAALSLVFFWNAMITYPFFYLMWQAGPQAMGVGWLSDYWRAAADFANFLSTAALTYYFVTK